MAIPQAELMLDVNTKKPSKEEIEKAILQQKNRKDSGPDGIPAEILKADINTSTRPVSENISRRAIIRLSWLTEACDGMQWLKWLKTQVLEDSDCFFTAKETNCLDCFQQK